MSDGDSVTGGLKDLGRETVKQIASVPKSLLTGAASQVVNSDSGEEEAKKKAEKALTFQRVKEIEAEMRQIAAENSKKEGPDVKLQKENHTELQKKEMQKKPDEASRQAVGRAEQGRNFKG